MRDRSLQRRITLFLGITLSIAMGASLLLPLIFNFQQRQAANQTVQTTNTPRPTVPAPIADLNTINFEETYFHPSGLFTASVPSGWTAANQSNSTAEALVTMRNPNQQSIVEIRVIRPTSEQDITSAEGISEIFSDQWLTSSWREYSTWDESDRTTEEGRVVMDFNLTRSGQDYIARQEAFTDGSWVYSVRVVTPSNASQMLQYILENEVDSLQPFEQYVGAPIEWSAYFNEANDYIIRYPPNWAVVDASDNAPVSISGAEAELRVEVLDTLLDSESAVEDYVSGLRSGIEVESVSAIEQSGTSGFNVSYTFQTVDGETRSGLVTILNGGENAQVANLLLNGVNDVDLNTVDTSAEDTPAEYVDAVELLRSFAYVPNLQVASEDSE